MDDLILPLIRDTTGLQGTYGVLTIPGTTYVYQTVEDPWEANASNISCVPEGLYPVLWCDHPEHGFCYQLQGTDPRTGILMHVADFGGSSADGFKTDLEGCIGVAKTRAAVLVNGIWQFCVQNSGPAIQEFNTFMNGRRFNLQIKNNFGKISLNPA